LRSRRDRESKEPREQTHYSISGIKLKYGVTDAVIKKLGEPDKVVDNPHSKGAPPMKLYEVKRVDEFIVKLKAERPGYMAQMRTRQNRAKKAVDTKLKNMGFLTENLISNLIIKDYDARNIPSLTVKQHINHLLDLHDGCYTEDDGWQSSFNSEVAYIRHQLTNYETILATIKGKVGTEESYQRIKAILNEKIIKDYKRKLDEIKVLDSNVEKFNQTKNGNE